MPDTTPQSRQRQYAKQKNLQNFSRNIFPASLPGLLNCRVITAFGQTLRNITGATNLGDVVVNQGDLAFRADRPPDNQPAGNCSVIDRKSTRLNSSHRCISYAVFCLKIQIRRLATSRPPRNASGTLGSTHQPADA